MAKTLRIETARVFRPLLDPARYKGAFGGRGSGKSRAFAAMLLERCLAKTTRAVCVREFQRTLEQSVKRLLEDLIGLYELGSLFRVLNTHIETPGGGIIIFQGMQAHTAESIKSLEGYDVAWVEEAQVLSQRSLDLLRPTIRVPDSELWFSWNPRNASDPVDAFLRDANPPPGAVTVEAQWRDNPWFPAVLRAEMEWDRAHDPEKYAHVWLGKYEQLTEARVFKNWRIEEFETPPNAEFYFGADWGFAVDPTALVRCWIDGRTLYIDREVYRVGCEIEDTPALFDSVEGARGWVIRADSARPETISYMQRHGYPKMRAATKGPNSVEEGVKFLQGYDIVIHPRCKHVIDEFTLYRYKTNALTGEVMPVLEDKSNHTIDSIRYACEGARRARPVIVAPAYMAKPRADEDPDHEGAVAERDSHAPKQRSRTLPSEW
jgi:phage terminase large subunit